MPGYVILVIIITAVVFGSGMFYLISQFKNLAKFLKIYAEVEAPKDDDYENPIKAKRESREAIQRPKHSKKAMISSFFKYLLILFIMVLITTINAYIIIVMVFAWGFTLYFTYHYIKLWKYHGYSVFLLIFVTLAVVAGAFVLSQMGFYKEAMSSVGTFIMGIFRG